MTVANRAWGKFLGFWFTPADPTTMGFIRIVAGCLVLYVHLVYTFDLNAFFGRTAWYDLDAADRGRREDPGSQPFVGWDHEQTFQSPPVPLTEGGRVAVFGWFRGLPADPKEQAAALRLIDESGVFTGDARPRYPDTRSKLGLSFSWLALEYARNLSPNPKERDEPMRKVTDTKFRFVGDAAKVPEPFDELADGPKAALVADLGAFADRLPADRGAREAVISYLQNLPNSARDNVFEFLRNTASDRIPAFERERRIGYLELWGFDERFAHRTGTPVFSIWYHVTEPTEIMVVHAFILVVMAMFTAGLFTRFTSVLTWLAVLSYLHRNPQVLFGQDTMMNIVLIYLMIANSGAALSLDRVIARYRAARASVARSGGIDAPAAAFLAGPSPSLACGFAQRMLQVHFCFIYMASGLSKLKGGSWWSADAMWFTLVNPEFTMIHWEWYQNLLKWAFTSRPMYATVAAGGVALTLFAEISLPYLVWTRLRPYIVMIGFMLHAGIGVFMGLLVFSLFMMSMLLCYLPGWVIRDHLFGPPAKPEERKRLPVNRTDAKSVHAAAWAVAWDTKGKVEI